MGQYLNSSTLRSNVLASYNGELERYHIDPYTYQAHHIIPGEVVKYFIETKYSDSNKEVFNEAWNAILIPSNPEFLTIVHIGSHDRYSKFIKLVLEKSDCLTYDLYVDLCKMFAEVLQRKFNELNYGSQLTLDQFAEIFLEPVYDQIVSELNQ